MKDELKNDLKQIWAETTPAFTKEAGYGLFWFLVVCGALALGIAHSLPR